MVLSVVNFFLKIFKLLLLWLKKYHGLVRVSELVQWMWDYNWTAGNWREEVDSGQGEGVKCK